MSLSGKRIQGGLILLGTIGQGLSHWVVVWLVATRLGADSLGHYSVVLAGASPIFVLASLGLRNIYLTLREPIRWARYLGWRLWGMVIGGGLLVLYGALFARYWNVVLGMVAMKVADGVLDIILAKIQRERRFTSLGLVTTLNALLTIVSLVAISRFVNSVATLLVVYALVSFLCVGIGLALSGRQREPESSASGFGRVLRAALPLTVTALLTTLLSSIPVWYLEWRANSVEVGRFAAMAYLLVAANLLGASVQTVLIPMYRAALEAKNGSTLPSLVRRHMRVVRAFSVVGGIAVVLLGKPIISGIYGSSFTASWLELLPLAVATGYCFMGYVWGAVLLVTNQYRSLARLSGIIIASSAAALALLSAFGLDLAVFEAITATAVAYFLRCFLSARWSRRIMAEQEAVVRVTVG